MNVFSLSFFVRVGLGGGGFCIAPSRADCSFQKVDSLEEDRYNAFSHLNGGGTYWIADIARPITYSLPSSLTLESGVREEPTVIFKIRLNR